MSHKWVLVPKTAATFLGPKQRKCARCGVVQEMDVEQEWGRAASRSWRPLVGRCVRAYHRNPMTPKQIYEAMDARREALGLSIVDVAEKSGVARPNVNRLLSRLKRTGAKKPVRATDETMCKLAKALKGRIVFVPDDSPSQ